jgi:hypothetical protein
MGSLTYIVHPAALDMHAADKDRISPGEVPGTCLPHVFVDEADIPRFWQHRRDDKQPLRRHEGANPIGQRIGIFEGAERRDIAWKDAKNVPRASMIGGQAAVLLVRNLLRHASHPEPDRCVAVLSAGSFRAAKTCAARYWLPARSQSALNPPGATKKPGHKGRVRVCLKGLRQVQYLATTGGAPQLK